MKARILNYRQGRRTITQNQVVLDMNAKSREEANKLLGTRVVFKTKNKTLHGVVSRVHGNSGKVVARFRTGLPGQCLGRDVEVVGKKPRKKEVKKKKAVKKKAKPKKVRKK